MGQECVQQPRVYDKVTVNKLLFIVLYMMTVTYTHTYSQKSSRVTYILITQFGDMHAVTHTVTLTLTHIFVIQIHYKLLEVVQTSHAPNRRNNGHECMYTNIVY